MATTELQVEAAAAASSSEPTGHGELAPLSEETQRLLEAWTLAAHPEEACGLLIGVRSSTGFDIREATLSPNTAAMPGHQFRVDAGHLMASEARADQVGLQLLGVWHSHPGGTPEPSQEDLRSLPGEWIGLVVSQGQGRTRVRAYRRKAGGQGGNKTGNGESP